jgi:hypothetical protein
MNNESSVPKLSYNSSRKTFGTEFFVVGRIHETMMKFVPVNEIICYRTVTWDNPTEAKIDGETDGFYIVPTKLIKTILSRYVILVLGD